MDYKNITNFVSKNAATILTILGVAGLGTTVVLAIKATPVAKDALEEAYEDIPKDESLSLMEEAKIVAPIYASTLVCGAATVACIIGSNSINKKRNVSLAAAYMVSEETLRTIRDKVADTAGEEVLSKIDGEMIKDRFEKFTEEEEKTPNKKHGTGNCIDLTSGRRFDGNIQSLEAIELRLNGLLRARDFVPLNELYSMIGLSNTEVGRTVGWFGSNHAKWNGDIKMDLLNIMHSDGYSVAFYRNEPVSRYA